MPEQCPVFHVEINAERIGVFHDVAAEVGRRRRFHKRREKGRVSD